MWNFSAQRGQTAIFVAVFVVMMGMILLTSFKSPLPSDSIGTAQTGTTSAVPSASCQIISDPKVVFSDKAREFSTGTPEYQDVGTAGYKLIRKSVPIEEKSMFKSSIHSEKTGTKEVEGQNYDVYYPKDSGEIYLKNAVYSPSRGDKPLKPGAAYGRFYFIDWGFVFLVHLVNGQPETVNVAGKNYYITDIYQNTSKPAIPDEAFGCQGGTTSPGTTQNLGAVMQPQASGENKQLQLNYFLFQQGDQPPAAGYVSNVDCKPAIYLYPDKPVQVNVKVFPKGMLTYTDPPYDEQKGWDVVANPDGRIEYPISNIQYPISNEKKRYEYLYYESKIRDEEVVKPKEGYAVSFDQLPTLYYSILPKLGLNLKQTQDFVDYWQKALPYSPYYFVGIMDQANVDQIERLEITPKPDFINRVRVYFERLSGPIQVKAPEISNIQYPISNIQFKVVEWGGMMKNDLEHPFTCSQ